MAAFVQDKSSFVATGSVTSGVVPLPSSWQPGDVLYIASDLASANGTITAPSGYTELVAQFHSAATTSATSELCRRVLQSGDTAPTVTCKSGRLVCEATLIRGADTVNGPEDGTAASDVNTGQTYPNVEAPSVTPAHSDSLLLTFHGEYEPTVGVTTSFTPPSGMTESDDQSSAVAASSNVALETAWLALTASGATGTKTATNAGGSGTTGPMGMAVAVMSAATQVLNVQAIPPGLRSPMAIRRHFPGEIPSYFTPAAASAPPPYVRPRPAPVTRFYYRRPAPSFPAAEKFQPLPAYQPPRPRWRLPRIAKSMPMPPGTPLFAGVLFTHVDTAISQLTSSQTSISVTLTRPVSQGDVLLGFTGTPNVPPPASDITDTAGNTWFTGPTTNFGTAIYCLASVPAPGGLTVTVAHSGSSGPRFLAVDRFTVKGAATLAAPVTSGSISGTSGNLGSSAGVMVNGLVYGGTHTDTGNLTWTPGTSQGVQGVIGSQVGNGSGSGFSEYVIAAAGGTESLTWTSSGSINLNGSAGQITLNVSVSQRQAQPARTRFRPVRQPAALAPPQAAVTAAALAPPPPRRRPPPLPPWLFRRPSSAPGPGAVFQPLPALQPRRRLFPLPPWLYRRPAPVPGPGAVSQPLPAFQPARPRPRPLPARKSQAVPGRAPQAPALPQLPRRRPSWLRRARPAVLAPPQVVAAPPPLPPPPARTWHGGRWLARRGTWGVPGPTTTPGAAALAPAPPRRRLLVHYRLPARRPSPVPGPGAVFQPLPAFQPARRRIILARPRQNAAPVPVTAIVTFSPGARRPWRAVRVVPRAAPALAAPPPAVVPVPLPQPRTRYRWYLIRRGSTAAMPGKTVPPLPALPHKRGWPHWWPVHKGTNTATVPGKTIAPLPALPWVRLPRTKGIFRPGRSRSPAPPPPLFIPNVPASGPHGVTDPRDSTHTVTGPAAFSGVTDPRDASHTAGGTGPGSGVTDPRDAPHSVT